MKILYFFIFLWVIFALLDPDTDPATQINADPDEDLDPQPCNLQLHVVMILHLPCPRMHSPPGRRSPD